MGQCKICQIECHYPATYCNKCRKTLKCSHKDCNNDVVIFDKLLCRKHYNWFKRGKVKGGRLDKICIQCGETYTPHSGNQFICSNCVPDKKRCKYEGCQNTICKSGFCSVHYAMVYGEEFGFSERICQICQKFYQPTTGNQKYCNDCRDINNTNYFKERERVNIKREKVIHICKWCCIEFPSLTDKHIFCSEKCLKSYYSEKNKNIRKINKKGIRSYPQKRIFDILCSVFNNLEWKFNYRGILRNPETSRPLELDIWCPEKKFAIEYDGKHHFSADLFGQDHLDYVRKIDSIKDKLCKDQDITLVRINNTHNHTDKDWLISFIKEKLNVNN